MDVDPSTSTCRFRTPRLTAKQLFFLDLICKQCKNHLKSNMFMPHTLHFERVHPYQPNYAAFKDLCAALNALDLSKASELERSTVNASDKFAPGCELIALLGTQGLGKSALFDYFIKLALTWHFSSSSDLALVPEQFTDAQLPEFLRTGALQKTIDTIRPPAWLQNSCIIVPITFNWSSEIFKPLEHQFNKMQLIGTRTLWSYFFTMEDFSYESFCLEILTSLSRAQMATDDFPELSDAIAIIIYHALSVRNPKMPSNTRLVLIVDEILMCTTDKMFEEWKRSHADVDVEFLEYRRREVRDLLSEMCKLMDRKTRFSIIVSSLDELVFDFGAPAFSYSYTQSKRLIKWVGLRVLNSRESENISRHLKEQVDRSDWSAEEISTFDRIIRFFFRISNGHPRSLERIIQIISLDPKLYLHGSEDCLIPTLLDAVNADFYYVRHAPLSVEKIALGLLGNEFAANAELFHEAPNRHKLTLSDMVAQGIYVHGATSGRGMQPFVPLLTGLFFYHEVKQKRRSVLDNLNVRLLFQLLYELMFAQPMGTGGIRAGLLFESFHLKFEVCKQIARLILSDLPASLEVPWSFEQGFVRASLAQHYGLYIEDRHSMWLIASPREEFVQTMKTELVTSLLWPRPGNVSDKTASFGHVLLSMESLKNTDGSCPVFRFRDDFPGIDGAMVMRQSSSNTTASSTGSQNLWALLYEMKFTSGSNPDDTKRDILSKLATIHSCHYVGLLRQKGVSRVIIVFVVWRLLSRSLAQLVPLPPQTNPPLTDKDESSAQSLDEDMPDAVLVLARPLLSNFYASLTPQAEIVASAAASGEEIASASGDESASALGEESASAFGSGRQSSLLSASQTERSAAESSTKDQPSSSATKHKSPGDASEGDDAKRHKP